MSEPVEKLRRINTPDREIEEIVLALDPATELDSMVRDLLCRIVVEKGPQTVILENNGVPVIHTGTLRWEIVHHEPTPGTIGRREATVWVE